MAFSDYTAALDTLRTHITNKDWEAAADQLLVVRTRAAEEVMSGSMDNASFTNAFSLLKDMQRDIELKLSGTGTDRRFLETRTNYASR